MTGNCKVCGHAFLPEPLLVMRNMPAVAQYLPGKDDLATEKGIDLEVCQCSGCGLIQLSNEPVPYYREVIRAAAYSPEMKVMRQEQFGDWVERYSLRNRKVLEIGCGRGEYLRLMQEAGTNAYGLEYSPQSVADCHTAGLCVERGYLETGGEKLTGAPFDGFFILNWLEHLPNINAVLQGIYRNLAPGGTGLVEVPNFNMILRHKLFTEFTSDHLFYFTAETLKSTLEINGFKVLSCREIWHEYIISAEVRKRPIQDLGEMAATGAKLRESLEKFIAGHQRTAVWGAGHQALAVMALAGLGGKIAYVVDSAPFKQGKYTPATNLPIVPPDELEKNPPQAIIVMAAAYSDEVAGLIRRKYGSRFNIAILREHGLEVC